MGLVTGLKAIKDREENKKAAVENKSDKKFVSYAEKYLPKLKDGETIEVRFLQELDEDADGYNKERGIGFIAVEHHSPIAAAKKEFWVKCLCTIEDEGQCVGCEQQRDKSNADNWKNWKGKEALYVNVLVNPGTENEAVRILRQGTSDKSITPLLIEYAVDDNTITDKVFLIKRKGSGFNDTSYSIRPKKGSESELKGEYELFDLEEEVNKVPYNQQKAYLQVPSARTEEAPELESPREEKRPALAEPDW